MSQSKIKFQNFWNASDIETVNMFELIVHKMGYDSNKFFKFLLTLWVDHLEKDQMLNPSESMVQWLKKYNNLLTEFE